MREIFKSQWTPEKLRKFRETNYLTQRQLASMLMAPQQRVSEWETGLHGMKRPYSLLMDSLANKLTMLKREANLSHKKFAALVKSEYGITIQQEESCKT